MLYDFYVYNLKHFPGLVRPALPALCLALALEIGETNRLYTLIRGLNTFCLENPGSITYTIPSIVMEVSATLVATIIFLPGVPYLLGGGALSNILCCWSGERVE